VGWKSGYLGVLQERKTVINVPHSLRDGCLFILVSHIYGCGRIYLKNEAAFGFDRDWDLVLSWGIAGFKKLGEMNF